MSLDPVSYAGWSLAFLQGSPILARSEGRRQRLTGRQLFIHISVTHSDSLPPSIIGALKRILFWVRRRADHLKLKLFCCGSFKNFSFNESVPSSQTFGNISNHVQSLHQEGRRVNSLLGPKDTYRYVEYPNQDETLTFAQILNGMKSC